MTNKNKENNDKHLLSWALECETIVQNLIFNFRLKTMNRNLILKKLAGAKELLQNIEDKL
jgi:hypothetical protein